MATAFISHKDGLQHETPPSAPERIARLEYIFQAIEDLPLIRVESGSSSSLYADLGF